MRLWAVLYATIWVVLLEFLLAMIPFGRPWILYAHVALGLLIVPLAYSNFRALRGTTVPGRIKRTASASYYLAFAVAALGVLLFFNVGASWTILFGITFWNVLLFFHVLNAFAIITQMAAVAIAYDMWEEKEFLEVTHPGEVPRPAPGTTPAPTATEVPLARVLRERASHLPPLRPGEPAAPGSPPKDPAGGEGSPSPAPPAQSEA